MKLILILLILVSMPSLASRYQLPLGGNIYTSDQWDLLDGQKVLGRASTIVLNKTHKDLKGYILGGTVSDQAKCTVGKKTEFHVCTETLTQGETFSYQTTLTRSLNKQTHQNYVLSFNFPINKKEIYLPLLEEMVKKLQVKQ